MSELRDADAFDLQHLGEGVARVNGAVRCSIEGARLIEHLPKKPRIGSGVVEHHRERGRSRKDEARVEAVVEVALDPERFRHAREDRPSFLRLAAGDRRKLVEERQRVGHLLRLFKHGTLQPRPIHLLRPIDEALLPTLSHLFR